MDESRAATMKTTVIVTQMVVKTALNPSDSSHSKSTKKRFNTARITKMAISEVASMRNVLFIVSIKRLSRCSFD